MTTSPRAAGATPAVLKALSFGVAVVALGGGTVHAQTPPSNAPVSAESAAAAAGGAPKSSPAGRPGRVIAPPSFGECEKIVNEEELRTQVASGARATMRSAAGKVDYRAIVEGSWDEVRFDPKFARIVDAQIAVLRQDRPYLERLLDGNIPSRAEEMAKKTADAVFGSEEFQALQTELQDEIGRRMEPLVAGADLEARTRATECIRVFLGQRYASTISAAFSHEARTKTIKPEFEVSGAGTVAAFSLAGIVTGILTIVFRRLVRRMVSAVVRRLAGAIAARLAAWASIVLGAALLVYELVVGADGVFPVIRDELTSPQTKQVIQASLVEELSNVAPDQLDTRADDIASEMIVRWRAFRESHRAVLELAAQEPRFRRFVEEQPPENFERLSVIVRSIKAIPPGGDAAVLDALDRGLLSRALKLKAIVRLTETWTPLGVSIIDLVAWSDRTKERFEAALAAKLPLHVKPDELSERALDRLLTLNDARAAERICGMGEPARSEALELDTKQLLDLTTLFESRQLTGLFDAIRPAGTADARASLIETVLEKPGLISRLDQAGPAVAASDKPSVALDILLSRSAKFDPNAFLAHANEVIEGNVAPMILIYRYGWGLAVAAGVVVLLVLWFLSRILRLLGFIFARRRR